MSVGRSAQLAGQVTIVVFRFFFAMCRNSTVGWDITDYGSGYVDCLTGAGAVNCSTGTGRGCCRQCFLLGSLLSLVGPKCLESTEAGVFDELCETGVCGITWCRAEVA